MCYNRPGTINEWADRAHQNKWMSSVDPWFCKQTRMFLIPEGSQK